MSLRILRTWLFAGILLAGCNRHYSEPRPLQPPVTANGASIAYHLERSMRVSINVYDADGQIVRALMNGAPRGAGAQTEFWDGRDRAGQPLPAGQYTWKSLAMPGKLRTEYLLTAGTNFPDPVEPEPAMELFRAVAPGTHGGPTAVVEDTTGVYIGAACTENIENYLVKLSPDGSKRLWWKINPVAWKGALAMARSGDRLLVLSSDRGDIWSYRAADGEDLRAMPTEFPPAANEAPDKPDTSRFATDLDGNETDAVLAFPGRGIVRWIDPVSGATRAEVGGLDRPSSVAISPDGTTYAALAGSILRLDRSGQKHSVVVNDLVEPGRLAVLGNGDLLVFVGAAKSQILRFSPDGKPLATYGAPGGRRDGRYDRAAQESFLGVGDLSAAADGGFLVSEPNTGPRRTARFDAQGRHLREWLGGHVWAPWIGLDPEDPRTVFMPTSWGAIMRLEIDYANKTWRVRSVHHTEGMADGLVPGHDNAVLYRAFRHDGRLYLARTGWPWVILRVDDATDQLIPVMVAMPQMRHYFASQKGPVRDWADDDDQGFLWTDADGDGRPQRSEVQFFKQGAPWVGLPDWDAGGVTAYDNTSRSLVRWRITGWNAVGAPELGDLPSGIPLFTVSDRVKAIEGRWGNYNALDASTGHWYAAFNSDMTNWGTSTDSFLAAYDATGRQRWIAGGRTVGTPQARIAPAEIGCFRRIAGLTHDTIVINDFMEGPHPLTSYVWDRDGLWVGGVMDEIDRNAAPTWRYGAGAEALGTTLWTDPKSGEVLLFWHGYNDIRIGRVTGWQGWQRQTGTLQLLAAAAPSTPSLTEVPPGTGTGLTLEAFKPGETAPFVRRLTHATESWGPSKGPEGITAFDGLNARVTGEVEALHTGWHHFAADNYPPNTVYRIAGIILDRYNSNEVYLDAGKRYPVEITYDPRETHPTTNHGIQLKWATPRGTLPGVLEPIPVTQLYPSTDLMKFGNKE